MLIPLPKMIKDYNLNITGIVHVGANEGQEAPIYALAGITDVIFIEAIPEVYSKLVKRTAAYKPCCIQACLSDTEKEVEFNIANNEGQSSSYLEFGTHKENHPDVEFIDKLTLRTTTLNKLVDKYAFFKGCNMLIMDIQGAELDVLKGGSKMIDQADYIYLEVNEDEVYKGCGTVDQIDAYLKDFTRIETRMTSAGWGDALYIRK